MYGSLLKASYSFEAEYKLRKVFLSLSASFIVGNTTLYMYMYVHSYQHGVVLTE